MSGGPLAGLTVVELAGLGPAPFACMTLAEMGAEVIVIDRPVAPGTPAVAGDLLNRGKRSISLDLKDPAAVEALHTLLETADVLIEGYRPGVAERLGLGPADVWQRNPKLVYGRMTGWGQTGPLSQAAGHDIGYIAITGALHAMGEAGGPPQIPLNLVGDFGGGSTYLVTGVLAAVFEAQRTGVGQVVDAAIVDGTAHLMAIIHQFTNQGLWNDERGVNLLDGGAPYYAVYETGDGRHMAAGPIEAKFYAEFVQLLGIDADPAEQNHREGWPALRKAIAEAFLQRSQAEWTAIFEGTDACVAPVLSIREALVHPHVVARGSVVEVDGVLQPGPAPRFSGHPVGSPTRPPAPGQHTREVFDAIGVTLP